jgi:hypothetical protein
MKTSCQKKKKKIETPSLVWALRRSTRLRDQPSRIHNIMVEEQCTGRGLLLQIRPVLHGGREVEPEKEHFACSACLLPCLLLSRFCFLLPLRAVMRCLRLIITQLLGGSTCSSTQQEDKLTRPDGSGLAQTFLYACTALKGGKKKQQNPPRPTAAPRSRVREEGNAPCPPRGSHHRGRLTGRDGHGSEESDAPRDRVVLAPRLLPCLHLRHVEGAKVEAPDAGAGVGAAPPPVPPVPPRRVDGRRRGIGSQRGAARPRGLPGRSCCMGYEENIISSKRRCSPIFTSGSLREPP